MNDRAGALGLVRPRRPRKTERVADAGVRDVAATADGAQRGEVDEAALVEDVRADVDVLDEPEDERGRMRPGVGVRDVECLVELRKWIRV